LVIRNYLQAQVIIKLKDRLPSIRTELKTLSKYISIREYFTSQEVNNHSKTKVNQPLDTVFTVACNCFDRMFRKGRRTFTTGCDV